MALEDFLPNESELRYLEINVPGGDYHKCSAFLARKLGTRCGKDSSVVYVRRTSEHFLELIGVCSNCDMKFPDGWTIEEADVFMVMRS